MFFSNKNSQIFGNSEKSFKKKGFSIIEVLIATILVSIGIVGIITTINYGKGAADKARSQIIAANMAREGMESIFNIRDTNRNRWGVKKDQCWLKIDPVLDAGGNGCESDAWITSGNYILTGKTIDGKNYYPTLISSANTLNLANVANIAGNRNFLVCRENTTKAWYNCPNDVATANDSISEGTFYREIRIMGLYKKTDGMPLSCLKGTTTAECGDGDVAKELRFCSLVEYNAQGGGGKVELCSVMTNFLK